jgi:uncharacterized protein DUF4303
MNREFELFRVAIQNAARAAFKNLLEVHRDEEFYAFALYTDDNLTGITAAAIVSKGIKKQSTSIKRRLMKSEQ